MNIKTVFYAIVVCVSVLIMGCTPKADVAVSDQPEAVPSFNAVYDLITQIPADESKSKFKTGDLRLVYGEKISSLNESAEAETSGGQAVTYVKIQNQDGKEAWIPQKWFVPNGKLGVVTSYEAVVYNSAKVIDPSSDIISRGTLVVTVPDETDSFVEFIAWDEVKDKSYTGKFLKAEDISFKEIDVDAARYLFLASTFEGPNAEVQKKELLKAAYDTKSAAFMKEITNEMNSMKGDAPAVSSTAKEDTAIKLPTREVEDFTFSGVLNDSNVNVRDYPYEQGTTVVAQLNSGDGVEISKRTVNAYTVGGVTANWYYISQLDGWIFGAFVDPM